MGYNYVNIIMAVVIFFAAGVGLSRLGGIGGIFIKIKKAFRKLRGYRD